MFSREYPYIWVHDEAHKVKTLDFSSYVHSIKYPVYKNIIF